MGGLSWPPSAGPCLWLLPTPLRTWLRVWREETPHSLRGSVDPPQLWGTQCLGMC